MAICTLLTDFGRADGFAGAVKGVIACGAPGAQILDISHEVPPGDVEHGAFVLAQAAPFFPAGTVHLAVVDPGVGTAREAVVVRHGGAILVGPNNGLLSHFAPAPQDVFLITNVLWLRPRQSETFHGRDVFAPAAAALLSGSPPEDAGPRLPRARWVRLPAREPSEAPDGMMGEVVHVDRFGNLITNLPATAGLRGVTLEPSGPALTLVRTYGEVAPGAPLAYVGSQGTLELAVRDGRAADVLAAGRGTRVRGLR